MRDGEYERKESEEQRLDRNLNEFLQELRVALPGVQILFAFLLTVAFQDTFQRIERWQEDVYFVALISTAIATALLISPTSFHRLTFRRQQKPSLIAYGNKLALAGLAFMALAICCSVLLVASFIFGTLVGLGSAAALLVLFAVLWWGLPLHRIAQDGSADDEDLEPR